MFWLLVAAINKCLRNFGPQSIIFLFAVDLIANYISMVLTTVWIERAIVIIKLGIPNQFIAMCVLARDHVFTTCLTA